MVLDCVPFTVVRSCSGSVSQRWLMLLFLFSVFVLVVHLVPVLVLVLVLVLWSCSWS